MPIDPNPLVWADYDPITLVGDPSTTSSAANLNRITAEVASEVEERIARARALTQAADSVAYASASDLAAKAPLASPAFSGTPTGLTRAHVGLSAVDNTADIDKPVSTAQAAAIAAGGVVRPLVQATKSAAQSTSASAGAATVITFDTETFDTDGMHSLVTNTSRLTCVLAGYYRIIGKVGLSASTPYLVINITKNGTPIALAQTTVPPATGSFNRGHATCMVSLAVNDYLECTAASSVASTVIDAAGCAFEAEFLRA